MTLSCTSRHRNISMSQGPWVFQLPYLSTLPSNQHPFAVIVLRLGLYRLASFQMRMLLHPLCLSREFCLSLEVILRSCHFLVLLGQLPCLVLPLVIHLKP